ncbi:hypothetical protein LEN26_020884 [Aphanomyces euteiches]|nr:hypothetical protein LEN26_020884 [Aphanomyces euteiches]
MEPISEDACDDSHTPPTTPRDTRRSISHRRVKSIVVGGAIELNKIKKEHEVETLHSELEKQSKALEVSQEETQLAARIGQSLLLQNQQLDYELESKVAALTQRCEDAEQQVKVLERKLHDMAVLQRETELHRTKAMRENDALHYELTQAKAAVKPLKDELAKTKEDFHTAELNALRSTSKTHDLKARQDELVAKCADLTYENEMLNAQLSELQDIRQESSVHIDQLVTSLEATTQKHHELQAQFDFLSEKHNDTTEQFQALKTQYEALQDEAALAQQQVVSLSTDLETVSELLEQERQVHQDLLNKHEEMIESVANGNPSTLPSSTKHARQPSEFMVSSPLASTLRQPSSSRQLKQSTSMDINESHHGRKVSEYDCSTMLHQESVQEKCRAEVLKRGSLFHELSRELEKEFQKAKQNSVRDLRAPSISCSKCSQHLERETTLTQQVESFTLEVERVRSMSVDTVEATNEAQGTCATCSELKQRAIDYEHQVATLSQEIHQLKQQLETVADRMPEENMLKEFFVLTAAALKITGAGIDNDRCNISNEDLYDLAMREDITFDKFHEWIYAQLEPTAP